MSQRYDISWGTLLGDCKELARDIGSCDAIVAIGRGGLIPGTFIAYMLDVPVVNFSMSSYTDERAGEIVINQIPGLKFNSEFRDKRVVIVDDLSDKGATLSAAKDYFESCEFADFKFATLYMKNSTKFVPNFYIKKFADDIWLDFPWDTCKLD